MDAVINGTSVPLTGVRDHDIDFRIIRKGLRYFRPQVLKPRSLFPNVRQLILDGEETSVEHPGYTFTTITPRPHQAASLRDYIMQKTNGGAFMLKGRFSWVVNPFQQEITCQGVRLGFLDVADLVAAKVMFDTVAQEDEEADLKIAKPSPCY